MLAVFAIAVLVVVLVALHGVLDASFNPYLLLTLGIIVAAWFGGLGPGLVATALSVVAIEGLAIGDGLLHDSLGLHLPEVTLFVIHGILISWLGYTKQQAIDFYQRSHEFLEKRIAERTGELMSVNAALTEEASAREAQHEQLFALNAKLQESNRELQDFASIASHDLQEPLRKIQAFGDRLGARYSEQLEGSGRDYLDRMQNAASRMQVLINDLLTFSRVTSQGKPFVPVDLNQIAAEVTADLEQRAEDVGGHVQIDPLPTIDADPLQMRQLLQNLISNALKFRNPEVPPQVRVYAQESEVAADGQEPQKVSICVEDNGIGLDVKYLDRIFQVFQRLHGRQAFQGTGIGLAVCRKIALRHGGDITARSEPGKGATFVVTLPTRHTKGNEFDDTSASETHHDPAGR